MRVGVVTFPGSLDDVDAARALRIAGHEAVALWHGDHDLQGVTDVRQGKRFELEIDGELTDDVFAQVREMAATLLSNPVIEDFTVSIETLPGAVETVS